MRCPKCSYISFDKVTSCVKCSTDVAELAHSLNGTAFKPLGTFYLGTLLPDYAAFLGTEQGAEEFAVDSAADDLDISMDAIGDFDEVPDLPGDDVADDIGGEDFSFAAEDVPEFDGDDISLDGHEIPDMDLSSFEESNTGFNVATPPVEETAAPEEVSVDDVSLDDVPEFDLGGLEIEEEADLEMADEGDAADVSAAPDLSDIDLSLGEDDLDMAGEEETLDIGDIEMEADQEAENGGAELPDLEL